MIVTGDFNKACLMAKYKQRLKLEPPGVQEMHCTKQSEATLQDVLHIVNWNVFRCSLNDMDEFTEAVLGFIGKVVDDIVPKMTIKTYPNQKPREIIPSMMP